MKNKKLFLRITSFIIVLFTIILIGRVNSNATKPNPPEISYLISKQPIYTIKNDKLVDNKVSAFFCNLIYDEKGEILKKYYNGYRNSYENPKIALYIDDNEEPYKIYEMTTDFFWSFENCGRKEKVNKFLSCSEEYEVYCDNTYEFDLTGVEIKESFEIVFSWEENHLGNISPYSQIINFTGCTENSEIIITRTYWKAEKPTT